MSTHEQSLYWLPSPPGLMSPTTLGGIMSYSSWGPQVHSGLSNRARASLCLNHLHAQKALLPSAPLTPFHPLQPLHSIPRGHTMVSISLPVCLGNPYVCPMVPQPPPLCSWSLSLCRFPFQLITLIYFPLCPSHWIVSPLSAPSCRISFMAISTLCTLPSTYDIVGTNKRLLNGE